MQINDKNHSYLITEVKNKAQTDDTVEPNRTEQNYM